MISLSKSGNTIIFEFQDNGHYLQNGKIEVPVNSLSMVIDNSNMVTLKKSATNDIFISGTLEEFGMTKAELETYYKNNMVGSTGGGSITIDPSLDSGSTNAVANSAITAQFNQVSDDMGGIKLRELTQEEYDALVSGGTIDSSTLYVIIEPWETVQTGTSISSLSGSKIRVPASATTDIEEWVRFGDANNEYSLIYDEGESSWFCWRTKINGSGANEFDLITEEGGYCTIDFGQTYNGISTSKFDNTVPFEFEIYNF